MKTALNRYIDSLKKKAALFDSDKNADKNFKLGIEYALELANTFVDLEKEQVIKSFEKGIAAKNTNQDPEKYFNQTYKK